MMDKEIELTEEEGKALVLTVSSGHLIMPYPRISEKAVESLVTAGLLEPQQPYAHVFEATEAAEAVMKDTKRRLFVAAIPNEHDIVIGDADELIHDIKSGFLADEIDNADWLKEGEIVFSLKMETFDLWTLAHLTDWDE